MRQKVQLNYDELRTVVKKFRDEGEDVVQMRATMRDRVHDLHKDWVGEGADKFFREMENDLLPALARLSSALFYAQDVLHKIIKTIQTFDQDTAGYFKIDFAKLHRINLGAFLAGAGIGAGIGSMAGGSSSGGLSGAVGAGVGGPLGAGLSDAGSGDSSGGTGEPIPNSQAGSGQTGGVDQTPGTGNEQVLGTQTAGASVGAGGGGGGGGSSSQGLQGNQQGMGVGGGTRGGGGVGGGSIGGGSNVPDHIYEGSSGAGAGDSSAQTSQAAGAGGGGEQGSAGGEGTVAAGAAGVAGSAAIGGAGKALKGRLRKKKR
jgi:WXG100 family type VII secretion target